MMKLYEGDCLEVLKDSSSNFFDTIITDPPYGLSFMGKDWDYGIPGVRFWKEFLRVCKPGAFALVFGSTRTHHRLTCAIEDAGWEIRDCMMWLYGSGFPKSLDISKAIDRRKGKKRKNVIGKYEGPAGYKKAGRGPKTCKRNNWTPAGETNWGREILEPVSKLAKLWDGYGTAFKPSWEPIIVAMKPLDGTFAQNAEKWDIAGLNIDGARIGIEQITINRHGGYNSFSLVESTKGKWQGKQAQAQGRWPANLILDEEAAKMLDEQSGISKPKQARKGKRGGKGFGFFNDEKSKNKEGIWPKDMGGGASRFFYCAKASKSERGDYNNHPTVKPLSLMEYLCKLTKTPTGGIVLDPFSGSGTTGIACHETGRDFVLIEKESNYCEIARNRLKSVGIVV